MGLFDCFPWVNTHELNLDWIIQKMKEWGIQANENVNKATEAARTAGQDALAANNSAAVAQEAASMAKDAAEGAEARAQVSATNAANAETAATNAETAATNAQLNATAARNAAESALSAAAQSWPYIYSDNYGVYRLNTVTDPVTNSNKIYMLPPAAPNLSIYAVDYPLCLNKSGQQVHPYCFNARFSGTENIFAVDVNNTISNIVNPEILGVFVKRFETVSGSFAPGTLSPGLNVQLTDGTLTAEVTPRDNYQKDIWIQIFVKGGSVG